MLAEIFDGPPDREAYVLNPGDPGLGHLDYDRKLCGIGMFVIPSANVNEDMKKDTEFLPKHQRQAPGA
jgi:hypothetical protein